MVSSTWIPGSLDGEMWVEFLALTVGWPSPAVLGIWEVKK